ncbi:hypothetical protein [Rhizobium tubonense]|uniref:Uncharacterized protein n=1 Tax=Rhizobium tubonense TaxID=484088 RepID=A0A2W4CEV1_9HYPH|nr:hypothetical protein [Rhizobium tubonense]PZM09708.1 hypothetical protein CPY51_25900 [Rhizobium tubonense]
MANLGISNTHVNHFDGSVNSKRLLAAQSASRRRKLQTGLNVALIAAAFLFVVALVCGLPG